MGKITEREGKCLQVQMFGSFSMFWDGKRINASAKSSESQFMYLMQMLLHNREEGVSRDNLEQVLFGDRDIDDIHHALRSVIYNAKRKLKAAGLPEGKHIIQKKGVYYWSGSVAVEEDAERFQELCRKADAETNSGKRLQLYLEACQCYTGDFLANQAATLWVAQETKKYRGMFCVCVEKAVALLREEGDFRQMKELGMYAAQINPMSDWETVTMEALMSMGQYEEAQKLYDDTVEMYFREQGLRPSDRLMKLFNDLGSRMNHQYDTLDNIQKSLEEEAEVFDGGYVCAYPVFLGIYRMMVRMMERGGQSVYLMLCRVVDSKGNPMKDGTVLDELSIRLGDAIRMSVRHSDVLSKYGKGQYLVLLVNTTRENCSIIQKRINWNFLVGRQRTGVRYYISSVICSPDKAKKPFGKEIR